MRKWLLALAFVAIALAGCTYAPPPSVPSGLGIVDFSQIWYGSTLNWFGMACIAIMMSAFFVSIAYMIGSALNNAMIINWAKSELLQVFASALIVGGLFWLVSMIIAMSAGFAPPAGMGDPTASGTAGYVSDIHAQKAIAVAPYHILVAQQYLEITYENLFEMTRDLLVTGSIISAISNFNITLELLAPPWISATFVPFASLNMIFETLTMCFDMLTKTMMLLKFQEYFLSFVWMALFPILLVLGVILRTFWFSRRLGGLLIAIAIGIYMIFPLLYTMAFYVLTGTSAGTYVMKIDPSAYKDLIDVNELDPAYGGGTYNAPAPLLPIPHATTDMNDIAHRINVIENKNFIGDILSVGGSMVPVTTTGQPQADNWVVGNDSVLENTAKLMIYATFIPFMVLMGTIAFIKGLSPLLGGDVEIAGITHLI